MATLAALPAQAAPDPSGRWEGEAQLSGQPLPVVVDLARSAQGGWQGRVTLPGRFVAGAPLAALKADGKSFEATFGAAFLVPPDPPPRLQLQWRGADLAQGSLALNGLQAPLQLRRSGPAQLAPAPAPSLPLDERLLGTWTGRYVLGGNPREVTLTLTRSPTGQGGGTLLIVGKRRTELKLDEVHLGASLLRLEAHSAGISIEGRWSPAAIDALFEQGPFEATLPLRRPTGATP